MTLDHARSIPAFTGEPLSASLRALVASVHPRFHGGAPNPNRPNRPPAGPSPLSRGSRGMSEERCLRRGSIPAFTGEPRCARRTAAITPVHPRFHGGARPLACGFSQIWGPSPLSRGSLFYLDIDVQGGGSIPAFTGEPHLATGLSDTSGVHPRFHGGAQAGIPIGDLFDGPSPLSRGSHRPRCGPRVRCRSIPAFTGEPPLRAPRTGGA